MFEIGFSELMMVGLVSLLVIGPEKLPKMARLAGFWIGRTQKMIASVKAEIKHELQIEEIRQALAQQVDNQELYQLHDEVTDIAQSLDSSLKQLPKASGQAKQHEQK
jgi:sec-independent protein translocase protein TatB